MRKAVKLWETSEYWQSRAKGTLRHAKYKELPTVRALRIKTIEGDIRATTYRAKLHDSLVSPRPSSLQLVPGIEGFSSQPVRRIVLRGGLRIRYEMVPNSTVTIGRLPAKL